ncbi:helix-turn-helix domain-containing protein [Streptomyces sp. NPDC056817]|uniref:helix-turn-helix domain-containing protein n=1 Tax=Streptomyces sp. NPDC056817 TaxID=3345950 RepID=UPI003697CE7B
MSQVSAGSRITERLRSAAGRRVCDAGSTVVQTARDLGLSWPTVMDAFRTAGQEVRAAALGPVEVLGIDETRRGTGGDERAAVMKEPAGPVRRQCGEPGCRRSAARYRSLRRPCRFPSRGCPCAAARPVRQELRAVSPRAASAGRLLQPASPPLRVRRRPGPRAPRARGLRRGR